MKFVCQYLAKVFLYLYVWLTILFIVFVDSQGETTTDMKTEDDKTPAFEVPEGPVLPSEGVEYSGLPDNQVNDSYQYQ